MREYVGKHRYFGYSNTTTLPDNVVYIPAHNVNEDTLWMGRQLREDWFAEHGMENHLAQWNLYFGFRG